MSRLPKKLESLSRQVGAMLVAPSSSQLQSMLLLGGFALLFAGLSSPAEAYNPVSNFNDDRIAEAADVIMTYIHGSFGALIMVCSGIAAILSAAFGGYRAALGLLVVAVGSFILRSLVSTWFNDSTMKSI
jgi:hypothetical protein